jgi:DNA topoisomerase I
MMSMKDRDKKELDQIEPIPQAFQYVDDFSLCVQRRKRGRGYVYLDEHGHRITAAAQLARIKNLVIPPMWTEVKICKFEDGHIQAIGRDLKGRKQFIYHSEWERKRQEEKFARMIGFGKKLPKLRKQVAKDLRQRQWNKTKVMALMVEILDETGIRIGNKQYAKSNGTYGLTTLRRKHLHLEGQQLTFKYKGKSNKEREVTIEDMGLIRHIRKVTQLPGYEIFRYIGEDNKSHEVDSQDVNEYINSIIGNDFSSKDFRTWVGSRLAIELIPEAIRIKEASPRRNLDAILIRMVADELGNTPTVCRGYYIHPMILTKFEADEIPKKNPFRENRSPSALTAAEKLLLHLLED